MAKYARVVVIGRQHHPVTRPTLEMNFEDTRVIGNALGIEMSDASAP
ncbi:hypothetical protein GF420_03830 [candidate division GN15 bacterium]|nr:hypothetical protein [candidate division GN15 bacterium]